MQSLGAERKKHKCDRLFFSSRGLHFVFSTTEEAAIAYQDGISHGFGDWLILEDAQMIDARPSHKTTGEQSNQS